LWRSRLECSLVEALDFSRLNDDVVEAPDFSRVKSGSNEKWASAPEVLHLGGVIPSGAQRSRVTCSFVN
jgi:hypothetical protein